MADAERGEGDRDGQRRPRSHRLRRAQGRGHSDRLAEAIQEAVAKMPEVVACHIVSGAADFLLEVVVPDLRAYERFLLGSLLKLPSVSDVRSNFAIRTVKTPGPLPLGHLA
jgi:Lrp/AsnC family leucine-responsive transcriptional regulator